MIRYVELHARSAFSFLQGASLPEEYAETAANFGMPAMALLDRDGVYGSPRFFAAMKKHGLHGHTGAEVRCTDGSYYPLLVKSRTGYQNLCRLITRIKLRTAKHPKLGAEAAATPEEIAELSEGLICVTGDGDGPLAIAIRKGQGRSCLERLLSTFGRGNLYAEGKRRDVSVDLGSTSNLFAKGHRIRLDISSSSFPRLEPNPGTGELGMWVKGVSANNALHTGAARLELTVLPD